MSNIIKNRCMTFVVSALCVGAFMIGALGVANANKSDVRRLGQQQTPSISVMLGKAEMISIGGDAADILVANPSVIDVIPVKSDRLYMVGSSLGDTNVMVLDADGNILKKINVHVQMDTDKLEEIILNMYPDESVDVSAIMDQVILAGEVSTPAVANKIANFVGHYIGQLQGSSSASTDDLIVNMLDVRGQQQVMLRVKIVEVSRSALKDLGIEAQTVGAGAGRISGSASTASALGLSAPTQLGVAALNYTLGDFGTLGLLTRALEQEGIVNTLAEPTLTAISGEQAGFLAGGEFPIPTSLDRNGNVVYEFRPFGVSLNFRPLVLSGDRISLQLTTEISTTSFDQNLQLNGVNIPTFNVRRAETTVELPSGGTLMIAGLLKSDTIAGLTQLPGIGDVPIIGDLIKSDTFKRNESEVIIMITPYLVKPFSQSRSVQAPVPTAPIMQPDTTMNYGAILPEDFDMQLPLEEPVRQESQLIGFFGDNMRRLYGDKAPENLIDGLSGFGYVLD